jgi:hypothetical protein
VKTPFRFESIFCGGNYELVKIPRGKQGTTFVLMNMKTGEVNLGVTVIYQCVVYGNMQSFFKRAPKT